MTEPEKYVPKGIAFFATAECPGGCDHCNIRFDSIDTSRRLPVEAGVQVLREGAELGLKGFQIVGGEPTIYREFFVDIVREGLGLGLKCNRPPTNCCLGGDEAELRVFFEALSAAGFRAGFRISLDHFHRRIPLESVARFITMASEYFPLKPFIIGCCDRNEERSVKLLHRLAGRLAELGLGSEYSGRKLRTDLGDIKVGFWAPTRPTWKPLPDDMFEFRRVVPGAGHREQTRRGGPIGRYGCLGRAGVGYFWIEPTGAVRLCCGNSVNFTDALAFGNIHEDSLGDILWRANRSSLVAALAAGGPVEVIERAGAGHYMDGLYTHRCELCWKVLNDPEVLAVFKN